jgi:hypothetical protein
VLKNKGLLFLIITLFSINTFAQFPLSKEWFMHKKAFRFLRNEKYSESQEEYLKLLALKPNKQVYNLETGIAYLWDSKNKEKSIPYLEKALLNHKNDTSPEALYYLAQAYHYNSEFEKSNKCIAQLKPFVYKKGSGKELSKELEFFELNNNNGISLFNSYSDIYKEIKLLPDPINTPYSEYAPVYKKSDNILLFTARRGEKNDLDLMPFEDIYAASNENSNWTLINDNKILSKILPPNYNSKKHDAAIAYSIDEKNFYAYKEDKIWVASFNGTSWSDFTELDEEINKSVYNVSSIALSKDGNTLFFVSTRKKDNIGGKDIYISKKENGKWSKPKNIGENINTKFDEEAPFLSEDGSKLYFSSKGHNSIGGYDIFVSIYENGTWSKPQNIGLPINSPMDDIFFIITDESKHQGYFSSNRKGGIGYMDIYAINPACTSVPNFQLASKIIDDATNQTIQNGSYKLYSNDNLIKEGKTLDGILKLELQPENNFVLEILAENYKNQKISFTTPKLCESKTMYSIVSLSKIADQQVLSLKLFTGDTTNLMANNSNQNIFDKLLNYKSSSNEIVTYTDTMKLESEVIADNTNQAENAFEFIKYFDYNDKKLTKSDNALKEEINKLIAKAGNNSKIILSIEGSASKVPTKTWGTNKTLAIERATEAQQLVTQLLIEKGIDKNNIKVASIQSLVQGPNYANDYKNIEKYKPYQFIKVSLKVEK